MTTPIVHDRRVRFSPRMRLNSAERGIPDRIVRRGDTITLEWKGAGGQCVMEPEEPEGYYRISAELVRTVDWITKQDRTLTVAGVLTFRIVGSREVFVNGAIFVTYLTRLEATA